MEPKFGVYIKFNGFIIVILVGYILIVKAYEWFVHLQNWNHYAFLEGTSMRHHPVVDGIFQIAWIIATASLYQALQLEVKKLLYPIGFVVGVEALIIAVRDVIHRMNDDAEECFLRSSQDVIVWLAVLIYFYFTLYILEKLFLLKERRTTQLVPASTETRTICTLEEVQ
uniref:Uncharacterized protein n=1 Tax=Anopheles dirus TaxID=7168 RepID=A0A9I3EIA4_9DIPT